MTWSGGRDSLFRRSQPLILLAFWLFNHAPRGSMSSCNSLHLPLEMLIYQGFAASQGCQKNIFRQNPLHPFSVLWISYRTRVRFAVTAGYIFLTWGSVFDAPLDLRIADEDEPSHVSGRLGANIPSFGLVIRRRPAKLSWGLEVAWRRSRQLLRCHPVVKRFFCSWGRP
ncbi:hypothetical protein BJQ97_00442 [Geobacillus sp. TFV-3]|nr:hypothetical protein BJQ97_00442 [Geobacillus sp. TFV-3]